MTGINGSYSNYANTSFHEIQRNDEELGDPPTPPSIPNEPGTQATQAQQGEVADYMDSVKTYLNGEGHTKYDAQLAGLKSYATILDWTSEQELYFLIGVAQFLIADAENPSGDASQNAKDALNGYSGQILAYLAQLHTDEIITDYTYQQLVSNVNAERVKIGLEPNKANSAQYTIFEALFADSAPSPSTPDEKQADALYTQGETKTAAFTDYANGLINRYNSYKDAIPIDDSAADLWLGKASSSTNPQAVTSALNTAKSSLQDAQGRITRRSGVPNIIETDITSAESQLQTLESLVGQIHSHPKDETKNPPILEQMQNIVQQIPEPSSGPYPGFRSALFHSGKDINSAETAIINTRKNYFPNDQPPAIPAGMMYFDTSYLKPGGKALTRKQMDSYLNSLKAAGCDTLILNFLMLGDAGNLANYNTKGSPWSSTWNDGTTEKFIQQADAANMKVWISIGGENIQPPGYSLGGHDAAALGKNLAETAQKLKLAGIDFDLESGCTSETNPEYATVDEWHTFLSALRDGLHAYGGKLSFTTLANPGQFAQFAYTDTENHPFFKTFDEFNPENYSSSTYYLNLRYMSQWAGIPGPGASQNPTDYMVPKPKDGVYKHMHIGFFDTPVANKTSGGAYIPYIEGGKDFATPSDGGGPIPDDSPVNASTPGQAAAMRYISEVLKNGTNEFGAVYFWPDEGTAYPPNERLPGTDFEKDFFTEYTRWNWLHNTNTSDAHPAFWETLTQWLPWNWNASAA